MKKNFQFPAIKHFQFPAIINKLIICTRIVSKCRAIGVSWRCLRSRVLSPTYVRMWEVDRYRFFCALRLASAAITLPWELSRLKPTRRRIYCHLAHSNDAVHFIDAAKVN